MKSTKNSLFVSTIALVLCMALLVGTTYAWFTDSAQSGVNQIQSGSLDVELYNNDVKVTSATKLFDDVALWEPGAVAYENLQVKNAGSLALKYHLNVNFTDEVRVNGHGLSEVLKVAAIDKIDGSATREQVLALAKAADNCSYLASFTESGNVAANAEDTEKTYVIFWEPSENDNLYNMNNKNNGTKLSIKLGVTLVAAQDTVESDSFDNLYDEDATYPDGSEDVAPEPDELGFYYNTIYNGKLINYSPYLGTREYICRIAFTDQDYNGDITGRKIAILSKDDDGYVDTEIRPYCIQDGKLYVFDTNKVVDIEDNGSLSIIDDRGGAGRLTYLFNAPKEFNNAGAADGGKYLYIGDEIVACLKNDDGILNIPNGFKSINWSFSANSHVYITADNITAIKLPASLNKIDKTSFDFFKKISSIKIDENNTAYDSRNNCNAIIETATNTLILGCSRSTIPEGIEVIGEMAFFERAELGENIIIPSTVKSIGSGAFSNCTGITSVIFDGTSKLINIEDHAFECCENLKYVTFGGETYTTKSGIIQALNDAGVTLLNEDTIFSGTGLGD